MRAPGSQLLAVLLVLLVASAAAYPGKTDKSIEAQLARWVTTKGGKLKGFKVGQECPTCLRGIVATKEFKEGDVIMKVPFTAVMRLKDLGHNGFPAEYARHLLDAMHNDPAHNETWDLFWSVHPGPDDVFTAELYTDEQLAMLQAPELESLLAGQREVTEQVYHGTYPYQDYAPFNETVGADKVPLHVFKWVSALLGSRYFGFYRDGNTETAASHLVPMVDLINHADKPNADRSDDGDFVLVKALETIKKGQEITNDYQPAVIHRPDLSLYIYGFVIMRDQPFMAAIDLPAYTSADPFGQSATVDDLYDDPNGEHATKAEYRRLRGLLEGSPTTEDEDLALLEGGTVADWRHRAILQFRVMRKRALRQALAKLGATLGLTGDEEGLGRDEGMAADEATGETAADEAEEPEREGAAEEANDEL